MADSPSSDELVAMWRKLVEAGADAWKKAVQPATLDALGLPSRDQIVGLSRQLMDLEDRLESLEDKVAAGAAPRPAATRATTRKATKKTAKKRPGKPTRKPAVRKTVAKRAKPKK